MNTLSSANVDQLFIRDCWAGNASYYWFEKKNDYPEKFTQNLIDSVLSGGEYKMVITLGSSKGGTAAIYYGLKNNVDLVFAGACQYKVGDYLARHQYKERPYQWERVVGGKPSQEWIDKLDTKLQQMIEEHAGCKTVIRLIYSTKEHTYAEHIKYLIEKLDECDIRHEDQVETFADHSMNGIYVKQALKHFFSTNH